MAAFHAIAVATPPHQAKPPARQRVWGGVSHTSVGGVNGVAGQGSRSVLLAPSVSRVLPPDLAEDEVPGLLEWGAEAVARSVKWLRSSYGMAAGWGLSEATLQVRSRCNVLNVTLDGVARKVGGGGGGCWELLWLLLWGEAEAEGRGFTGKATTRVAHCKQAALQGRQTARVKVEGPALILNYASSAGTNCIRGQMRMVDFGDKPGAEALHCEAGSSQALK